MKSKLSSVLDYIKTKSGIKMICFVSVVLVLAVALFFSIRYLSGVGSNYEFNIFTGEIARYTGKEKNVEIPERIFGRKVVKIGVAAFEEREDIESVRVCDGVTTIEDGAFNGCTNLREVFLPDTVTYIGHYTFCRCKNLQLVLPDAVSFLGKYAFYGCESLVGMNIPDGVDVINECTFANCTSLQTVTVSETVDVIAQMAFANCTSLKSVDFDEGVQDIRAGVFWNCTSLENMEFPSTLTKIDCIKTDETGRILYEGCGVFEGCKNLRNVNIPYGVDDIGDRMFFGCEKLEKIRIPDTVKRIGKQAFAYCATLTEIIIPDSVETMDFFDERDREGTFSLCLNAKKIVLPKSLTNVHYKMFYYCTSLEDIVIPENVEEIGKWAFLDCRSLKNVELRSHSVTVNPNAFDNCEIVKVFKPKENRVIQEQ